MENEVKMYVDAITSLPSEDVPEDGKKRVGHIFTEAQEELISKKRYEAITKCFPSAMEMSVRIVFIDSALGMSPNDRDIYRDYIASKAPDAKNIEEEINAVGEDAVEKKGMTVFPRNEKGNPCSWDYQWKGFFKDACSMLSRASGKDESGKKNLSNLSSKLTAFKKVIDGNIFVYPRMIEFKIPDGLEMEEFSRALRADTPQGPRVALSKSEKLPAGSTTEFKVLVLNPKDRDVVEEWLNYGVLHGFGQWRNGGFGVFIWEKAEDWHTVGENGSESDTGVRRRGRKKKSEES